MLWVIIPTYICYPFKRVAFIVIIRSINILSKQVNSFVRVTLTYLCEIFHSLKDIFNELIIFISYVNSDGSKK